MKTLIATLAAAALLAGGTTRAAAGDREWATAGKILTGVVAGAVIASAIAPAPVYTCQAAGWYAPPPPVYVRPAPVVRRRCRSTFTTSGRTWKRRRNGGSRRRRMSLSLSTRRLISLPRKVDDRRAWRAIRAIAKRW